MRVSLNTIKQYTDVNLPVDELVSKINQQLGGVEGVVDFAARFEGAVIARVVSCDDHPNADRLHVCKIDDGGAVTNVARDESGYVQVVCGAPNVAEGLYVVWLPPGATVPSSFDESEPFVLDARELRGIMSNGMLASARELGIGDDHDGILVIDPAEWKPNTVMIEAGTSFARAYGLDDTLIDIENKMFTHRPDLFGQLGVAREIAGIQHRAFISPEWYRTDVSFVDAQGLELSVHNDAPEKVPRFMAVALAGVEVKQSPLWLRCQLVRLGAKPINNIVDITNYIMLLTAQPVHAYDYDKLRGQSLGARYAQPGETVTLLNHKAYELTENDIVIVDGEGPVGLAGIMGGGDSEVSAETRNIVLEVATFDMYALRKSSMRHGVFTDALTRFNKGQSPFQNARIMGLLMSSILDVSPGEQASQVFDLKSDGITQANALYPVAPMRISSSFINERLGLELSATGIAELLVNVEFRVEVDANELSIAHPYWRTDIELKEDIVEEVGRLYGFGDLPRVLPQRSTRPAVRNERIALKRQIRDSLQRAGANEVLTYSFVHEKILKNATQDSSRAFKLSNALSPDLQYYRLSVLPSLLDKVRPNIKAGHDEFAVYEIGKAHQKDMLDGQGLPGEVTLMELVYASKKPREGAAFYRARRLVDRLCTDLGLEVSYRPLDVDGDESAPYEPSRSASIVLASGETVGIVGELKSSVRTKFKLPEYCAAATLNLEALQCVTGVANRGYRPLSRFPKVTQDISLRVSNDIPYGVVAAMAREVVVQALPQNEAYFSLSPLSIYQPGQADSKTITLRLEVSSYEKTLTDAEVSSVLDTVAARASESCGAVRI